MKESPLFWPVKLEKDTILCLDETALPERLVYLKAENLQQATVLIKEMKTRAFGQVLMVYYLFSLLLKQSRGLSPQKQIEFLKNAADEINASRPTFPFAFFTKMLLGWMEEARAKKQDICLSTEKKIEGFLSFLKGKRVSQAEALGRLFNDGDSVLTHCNVSGSLVMAAEFCRKQDKELSFFVTETRPYLQGARLTAWELQDAGFKTTIISDNSVAFVMAKRMVNLVAVGADQMARNGDIANKIGTYQIALLARKFNLPFYVLSPPPSEAETGEDINVEIRPEKELLEFGGRRIAAEGAKGFYPAFDITPKELITRHIGLEV